MIKNRQRKFRYRCKKLFYLPGRDIKPFKNLNAMLKKTI